MLNEVGSEETQTGTKACQNCSVKCQVGWSLEDTSSTTTMAWLDELTQAQSEHLQHGLCTIVSLLFGVPIAVLVTIVWLNDFFRLVTQPVVAIGLIAIIMAGVALPLMAIGTKLLHQLPVKNHTS